ncbi:hypothetical protein VKT23_004582 [Stygiomarasmius scandens]|uniref:Fungal N-terminal domain-containing protein n=1 Tax=Marasmiellus scandens TaxID=2682957 RepID=A0ABR1JVE2_9AGAR
MSEECRFSELLRDIPDSGSDSDKKSISDTSSAGAEIATTFLGVSVIVFDALKDASIAAPFPYAFIAASLALEVLNSVQGAKDNKRALQCLAKEACGLVYTVRSTLQGLVEKGAEEAAHDTELNKHLKALVNTLLEIKKFTKQLSERSQWRRFLSSRSDVPKIQEYRDRVRQALGIFSLQSDITVRFELLSIKARQETIHENLKGLHEKRNTYDSLLGDVSGTSTLVEEQALILDTEICESPVETETEQLPKAESATLQSQNSASVFDFSGSNIHVSGVTFNNISGSHNQVKNVDNSNMVNCQNVYYSGGSPDVVFTQETNYGATKTQSKNPFFMHHTTQVPVY